MIFPRPAPRRTASEMAGTWHTYAEREEKSEKGFRRAFKLINHSDSQRRKERSSRRRKEGRSQLDPPPLVAGCVIIVMLHALVIHPPAAARNENKTTDEVDAVTQRLFLSTCRKRSRGEEGYSYSLFLGPPTPLTVTVPLLDHQQGCWTSESYVYDYSCLLDPRVKVSWRSHYSLLLLLAPALALALVLASLLGEVRSIPSTSSRRRSAPRIPPMGTSGAQECIA